MMNATAARFLISAILLLGRTAGADTFTVNLATKDGNALVGTTDVATFKLETSLGTVDVKTADVDEISIEEGVATVRTRDGTSLRGKMSAETWTVKTKLGDLAVKTSNISRIEISAVRVPVIPAPSPAGAPRTPPGSAPGAAAAPAFPPVKTLILKASVSSLRRSADGKSLYVLNATDAKLLVVASEEFEIRREIALPAGASAFDLDAGGTTAVAVGGRTVSVIDLGTGKVTRSFDVENELAGVRLVDAQTVLATTSSGMAVISIPKQGVVAAVQGPYGPIHPAADGRKVYTLSGSVRIDAAKGKAIAAAWTRYAGASNLSEFVMTPDGRFAVSLAGTVYRSGKSYAADMLECARVEPHAASVVLPGSRRLLLFTAQGFVKEYDLATFELAKSTSLGLSVHHALEEESGKRIVVFAAPAGVMTAPYANRGMRTYPVGDLYRFAWPPE